MKSLRISIAAAVLAIITSGAASASDITIPYLEGRQPSGIATDVRTGSSVYYPSGTYYFSETDLRVSARSIPMVWERQYHSNHALKNVDKWNFALPDDGPLGFGWTNIWLSRVSGDAFVNEEGKYTYFAKDANGNYLPNMKAGLALKKTPAGFEVQETGGRTFVFNGDGKLIAIKDTAGNSASLIYDAAGKLIAIKDIMGRQAFSFTYSQEGRIATVTDLANRTISYEYDPYGNLVKVSRSGQTISQYTYNSNHGLLTKANALNETYNIEYHSKWQDKGIVQRVIDPVGSELIKQGQPPTGHATTFSYDFTNRIYYYTDYNGVTYKSTLNADGLILSLEEVKNGQTVPQSKVEYLENRVTRTTDVLGNVTLTQADEWGSTIKKTDPAGFEWKYAYDGNKRLISTTDPLGTITRYEYDASGNRTKETIAVGTPDESVTTYTYNQYNELQSTSANSATTNYSYDTAGNLTQIKDAAGNATAMTYDAAGNLLTRTIPLIGATTYENYDFQGNPGKVTDPNGHTITTTYDLLGRVLTATSSADGGVTQYSYVTTGGGSCTSCGGGNGIGKIASITLPEGNKISYDYDGAGNLTKITDNDGNSIVYTYDNKGNKTKEEILDSVGALQKTLAYQYDLLNRLNKTVNPDNSFTEYGYDKNGNRASLKNPNGNTTAYTYDAVNRLTKVTQPGNIATSYTYDKRNNLTSVTDANGNITQYEYDKQNRLVKTTSPDTGVTTYTYDANGNLKTKTDAKQITATYTYDAANRLTKTSFPDPVDNVTYSYDSCINGKGKLCVMTDPSGTTTYEYTKKGQLAKETKVIDGTTYTTEYSYDRNGNNTTLKYPSGRVVTYIYVNDKVNGIIDKVTTLASNISYLPFGRLAAMTYSNGIQETRAYDLQYRLAAITAGTIQNLNYTYDKNGNITAIADKLDSTKSKNYIYDANDRLTAATGPWGSLAYAYDAVGNRKKESDGSDTNYNYQANRLITTTGAKQYVFGYDANGNAVSEYAKSYVYNQNQRLIRVTEQNGDQMVTKGEYVYNGNGQRVKKVIDRHATIFFYDQQGKLLAEAGTISTDYLYLYGTPLAKAEGSTIYFYHNDHLGTPQRMTDGQKQIVWAGEFKPFGEVISITGTVTNNLRFPGQYFDQETGLNYNYYRDYNPVIGRYIEADPVGIKGGQNHLFGYTDNNPVNYTDPEGLFTVPFPNPVICTLIFVSGIIVAICNNPPKIPCKQPDDTKKCPPCPEPPPPRVDYVPPSRRHFPCPGDHMHFFGYHQAPYPKCICRLVERVRCL